MAILLRSEEVAGATDRPPASRHNTRTVFFATIAVVAAVLIALAALSRSGASSVTDDSAAAAAQATVAPVPVTALGPSTSTTQVVESMRALRESCFRPPKITDVQNCLDRFWRDHGRRWNIDTQAADNGFRAWTLTWTEVTTMAETANTRTIRVRATWDSGQTEVEQWTFAFDGTAWAATDPGGGG